MVPLKSAYQKYSVHYPSAFETAGWSESLRIDVISSLVVANVEAYRSVNSHTALCLF